MSEPIRVLVVLDRVKQFGPEVKTLEEAALVVAVLDWMFENSCLPLDFSSYTIECDIEAVQGDKSWTWQDNDPSGQPGAWFEV